MGQLLSPSKNSPLDRKLAERLVHKVNIQGPENRLRPRLCLPIIPLVRLALPLSCTKLSALTRPHPSVCVCVDRTPSARFLRRTPPPWLLGRLVCFPVIMWPTQKRVGVLAAGQEPEELHGNPVKVEYLLEEAIWRRRVCTKRARSPHVIVDFISTPPHTHTPPPSPFLSLSLS